MKKILKITGISLAVVAVSALLATGILALIRNKNVAKTGNVLGVSWYNETDKEFSVDTAEQLNELARLSSFYDFKGQTIKLSADIVLNSGDAKDWKSAAPKNRWTPITGFAGTFDGQGHTISGLYGKGHQSAMAMFVNTGDDCTIQNVKLVNSYIETVGSDGSASFVVNGSGTFKQLYSNAIISHRGDRAAGIFSRATRPAVLEECWFDGTIDITISTAGGIVDEVKNTTVDVNHCLFSGTINSSLVPYDAGRTYVGGMVGQVTNTMNQASAARMEDCLSSGVINAQSTNATGSFLGYIASGGQAAATIQNSFASNKTATVPYGSSTGSFTGNAIVTREQELLGEKGYQWTMLDFDNYWVAVENKAPELKWAAKEALDVTGVEKAYDISWYNSNEFMFELKTPEQLYGMAFLSVNGVTFAEKRVKLMKDIVLNEGNAKDWEEKEPELPWYPIANFHGVFDGKGHTVSGIYLKTAAQYQGFFTQVLQTGVVQDLSIKNSYFCSTNETLSMIGTIAGDFRGTLDGVYSDAIVVAHGPQVAGLIARSNDNDESGVTTDKVTVKNCWFDGEVHAKGETTTYAGGLVSAVIQGDLEINHCLNTGTIYSECTGRAIHVAGLVGSVSHVEARLVIKDSMNAGKIEAAYDVGVGSVLGRASSEKHSATFENVYTTEESHLKSIGTSSGTFYGGPIRIPESLYVGNNAYKYTNLDFERNWTLVKGDIPALQQFTTEKVSTEGLAKAVDTSWYNFEDTTFTVKNLKEFYGFAFLATGNNFAGKTVKLGADITVNQPNVAAWKAGTVVPSNVWVSIGNAGMEFNGTFDGQGHVIRGIYVKSDTQYTGLFGRANYNSVIKNFKLTDSYFCNTNTALSMTGSIAGEIRGVMENVYSNAVVEGYGPQIGGMVARINDYDDYVRQTPEEIADKVVVKNCWFDGEVHLFGESNTYAGGVVGALIQGDLEMKDCLNSGTVISDKTTSGTYHIGGLIGSQSHAESRLTLSDSLNVGKIVTQFGEATAAGSILGRVSGEKHSATIKNTFTTTESYVNGIGWTNGIVNGTSYVEKGNNDVAGTKIGRTQLVLRTDKAVKDFFGSTTKAWTCDVINNGLDRGTPILSYFAKWWIGSQPATKEASDTSWYKTTQKEFTLTTLEQLNGLAELSTKYTFEGQTFKLGKDIAVNAVNDSTLASWKAGTATPKNVWTPIGSEAKPFAGTFDGQGHTISGLYIDSNAVGVGMFGWTGETAVIKNFKLVDSCIRGNNTATGGIVGAGIFANMSNIYSNAIVRSTNSYAGGMVGQFRPNGSTVTVQIENCWFDGEMIQIGGNRHSVGGFIGNDASATNVVFKNCLSTGPVSGGFRVGGFYGWKNNYAVNDFHNCLSVAKVTATPSEAYKDYGAMVGSYFGHYNTSTWNLKLYNSYTSGKNIVGVYKNEGEDANFEIDAYLKDRMTLIETGEKSLFPALSGEQQNAWVNDIGYNKVDRGTPILEMFADWWLANNKDTGLSEMPKAKVDTGWYNTTATTFTLMDVDDLLGFAELVNSGEDNFAGKTVKLGADIQLNQVDATILAKWVAGTVVPKVEWTPIGTESTPFAGTFDGQGYSISGLYLNAVAQGSGLFGHVAATSEFKNFKLLDSYLKSSGERLGIVGSGSLARFENVYTNAIMESTTTAVAGFVGYIIPKDNKGNAEIHTTFKNCWFDGNVKTADDKYGAGGFVGLSGVNGNGTGIAFINCLSTGAIAGGYRLGGFYGWKSNYAKLDFTNCLSVATITATPAAGYEAYGAYIGAYVGDHTTSTYNVSMTNSYGVGAAIFGNYSETTKKFEVDAYLQDRMDIIAAGEKKLFPVLSGEQQNAWVNDIGYNAVDRGTPILETFAEWWLAQNPATDLEEMPGTKADTSWYNETDTEFVLVNVDDLLGLVELVNGGTDDFAGKIVKLGADIQINEVDATILAKWQAGTEVPDVEWIPIGTSAKPFAGTFDGQGYKISGLYLNAITEGAGLFGYTAETSEFKNFKFLDSYLKSSATSLGMIGVGKFTNIENIYTNAIFESNQPMVGGFVGVIYNYKGDYAAIYSTIKNCWFDGTITQTDGSKYGMGGFIGGTGGAASLGFYNCLSTGTVTGGFRTGGFYGWRNYYALFDMYNCLSVATVSTNVAPGYEEFEHLSGSIFGAFTSSMWNAKLYNTYGLNKINGHTGEAKYETEEFIKDRMDIISTDEAELFPALTGETDNAWVNDIGYNDTDRGTPILATFADWWLAENPDEGLTDRPEPVDETVDTSWYSDEATEFVLMDTADLRGFSKLSNDGKTFAGKTVKLGANIALNEVSANILETWKDGSVIPENVWTPIGTATAPFAGTFDGQGYTISGLYLDTDVEGAGLFGRTAATSEFRNFKLVDSYMKSSAPSLGIVGKGAVVSMENIYTNAIMISTASDRCDVAGFLGTMDRVNAEDYVAVYTSFRNCWFDGYIQTGNTGRKAGGFVAGMGGAASVGFYNCLSTGTITGGYALGGFFGAKDIYATCEIRNCLSTATVTANTTDTTKAAQFGSFFGEHSTSNYNSKMYTSYGLIKIVGTGNNPATGTVKTHAELVDADVKALFPDSDAWVQDPMHNTTDRGTPILATFAEWWLDRQPTEGVSSRLDIGWYSDEATEFTLTKASELIGFAELAKTKNFAGKTVKLGADIVLNEVDESILLAWKAGTTVPASKWTPIGTADTPFAGTFDGQGYTISGLYLDTTTEGAGLFGRTAATSEFKNFKLVDSYMKSSAPSLGIVGKGAVVSMENIYTNAIMISTASDRCDVAGFLGTMDRVNASDYVAVYTSFRNCWFDGYIQTGNTGRKAGGFVAGMGGAASVGFYNCLSTGTITGGYALGGFFGAKDTYATCEIRNCLSTATVTANTTDTTKAAQFGSFFGEHSTSNYNSKMYTSYGLIKIVGTGNNPATGTLKTHAELVDADVNELFPESTAWVQDPLFNDADRGTPILATFADWWLDRQPTEGVSDRVDTSWYSDEATEFTLTKQEEFIGFAELAKTKNFAGKTVKLGANINLNAVDAETLAAWQAGTAAAKNEWTPIGTADAPFAGIFDGQGYTISGLYLDTDVEGAGLFGRTAATSEFRNFKLVDSYMKSSAPSLGIVGKGAVVSMENIYTNAIMISTASDRCDVAGFLGTMDRVNAEDYVAVYTSFRNCWFDGYIQTGNTGRKAGGFVAGMGGAASVGFYNCLSTGTITGGYALGGFFGAKDTYATCEIRNCLSTATVTANTTDTTKADQFGSFFGEHSTSNYNSKMYTSYGLIKIVGKGNNPATGTVKTHGELVDAKVATLFPDSNAWVEDTHFNATDRGTPILSTFAGWWLGRQSTEGLTQKADKSWYTGNASEYTLTTAAQLMGLAELAKTNDFAGITIKLGKDITLNEVNETILSAWKAGTGVPARSWTPLGNATTPFAGKFDGQGYTIKGLYVSATTDSVGMFGVVKTGVEIEDFKLVDSYIKGAGKVGLVGNGTVTRIEKVYTNAIIESTGNMAGGFLGYYKGAYTDKAVGASENWANGKITIKNCWFAGEVNMLGSAYSASAFIGGHDQRGAVDMSDCLFTGKVSGERSDYARLGAFFGWLNNTAQYTFTNCLAVGTITSPSTSYVGGFVGNTGTTSGTFTNCYTTISPLVGTGSDQTYVNSGLKTINELQSTGVSTLFTSSAWEDVTGGTPILTYFAN